MNKIDKTKLSDQTKFRLHEIKKVENYFIDEINQRKSYSKKLSKYVTAFDHIDKISIVLYLFFYYCYWSTSWNSKCKFCISFFFLNMNH